MARKKKQATAPLVDILVGVFGLFVQGIIIIIYSLIRLVMFVFVGISIYRSGYKAKSGNGLFKTYFNKGNKGEYELYKKLTKIMDQKYILTNLYLPGKNVLKTELDVVLLTTHGIYVFEVKNYSGYIYGSEKDEKWTQVLNRFLKHRFYNPLRQNYAHTKALENYLGISHEEIIPVVSFSNRSTLSKINVNDKTHVLQVDKTIKLIKENLKTANRIYTEDVLDEFLIKLIETTNMDKNTKEQHINEVIQLKESKELKLEDSKAQYPLDIPQRTHPHNGGLLFYLLFYVNVFMKEVPMKTYDIKSDMPTKLKAGTRLANIIREAKQANLKVIKILHGYGSTGVGGSIKQMTRTTLRNRLKNNEIKAFIPGEAFASPMGFDEVIQTYSHLIKDDKDYRKMNDGITYVIL